MASLEDNGAWTGGLWTATAWTDGVWLEGAAATVEVPSCAAADEATCVAAIEGEGLVASVVSACSSVVAMGDVVATGPPAGSQVAPGSAVVVRISTGVACEPGKGRALGLGLGLGVN
jgi:beta-lactam-binding protein with PASTA domain